MAWTDPRTWVTGELVTAALLNEQIRDNLKALGDPWVAYTPTWTCGGTPPDVGDGTLTGARIQVGKLVHFRIDLTAGATTTYGTGDWRFSLPVAPVSRRWTFVMFLLDAGVSSRVGHAVWEPAVSLIQAQIPGTTAGGPDRGLSATVPFAWGSGDSLSISGTYEAA